MTHKLEANSALILLMVGGLLLSALALDTIGQRTRLPRVTLLMLFGLLIGPAALDVLPFFSHEWFPVISETALTMVGFLIGGKLNPRTLREIGRQGFGVAGAKVLVSALVVMAGLWALGVPIVAALLLGGIATATAPAATLDVIEESGARGPIARTIAFVVALDDVLGLALFSLLLVGASFLAGNGGLWSTLTHGAHEILGGIVVGILLGVPTAYLSGRIRRGEPTMLEATGSVLLCGGISLYFQFSYILAAITMGVVVAALAKHHSRPFHVIKGAESTFLILFFVLAGAALNIEHLKAIGTIGAAYVLLRSLGCVLGSYLGARLTNMPGPGRHWIGAGLLPQAGVALGMALIAARKFPELQDTILSTVIGTTMVFEIFGPISTRLALKKAGEIRD